MALCLTELLAAPVKTNRSLFQPESLPALEAPCESSVPEVDMLKALVANIERCRQGKDSVAEKRPAADNNVKVWGKKAHDREFRLNADGSASHFIRSGETLRAIAADVIREKFMTRNPNYEPGYAEIAGAIAEIKAANAAIADFDMLEHGEEIVIPASMVRQIGK